MNNLFQYPNGPIPVQNAFFVKLVVTNEGGVY